MAEVKLEDFGEYIAGAKKHNYTNFTGHDFSNEKTRSLPLSKLWTTKEIDDITDKDVAAIAKVLRDSIPNKPRRTYQLNRWFEKLQSAQDIVRSLLDPEDPLNAKDFIQTALDKNISGGDKIALLTKLDRADWYLIGEVMVMRNVSSTHDTSYLLKAEINGKNHWIDSNAAEKNLVIETELSTVNMKIADVKALIAEDNDKPKTAKAPVAGDFDIYSRNSFPEKEYYIAARADKKHNALIVFKTIEEARDYRKNHVSELSQLWENYKAMFNIKKSDMRSRLNEPRAGTDYRDGRDITPEIFMETFNIRGGQFGNWVNDKERTAMLNNAYDSFIDLSIAANIPPSAIGLNGTLGIAFGARGSGWAAAHYEPVEHVINLTKTKGAGSLAHEWWHALDHYISGHSDLMTRNIRLGARHEQIIKPIDDLVKKIRSSELYERSGKADEMRNKPYFQTNVEMTARAFEGYVVSELAKQHIRNDFLANVVPKERWQKASDAYPYPTYAELEILSPVYKQVFDTLTEVDKSFEATVVAMPHINATESQVNQPVIQEPTENAMDLVQPVITSTPKTNILNPEPEAKDDKNNHSEIIQEQRTSSKLGESKQDQYLQGIANRLLEQIQNNQAPWQQPFQAGDIRNSMPVNRDGVPYRGLNAINLSSQALLQGYQDNRWYTFNGAIAEGGKVKKGEKATQIHYWQFSKHEKDEQGTEKEIKLERPIFRTFYVFNAEQIEGLPERKFNIHLMTDFERHTRAEAILSNSGVAIEHTAIEKGYFSAHYTPSTDTITLPQRELFNSESEYYATALHELAHATGHESRLNRPLNTNYGSYEYAKEELRAEIASMFIGEELQIGHDPANHHAYLQHWVDIIKNDPKEFFKATADADKITQYIMTFDLVKDIEEHKSEEVTLAPFESLPQNQEYIAENFPIANNFAAYFNKNNYEPVIDSGLTHTGAFARLDIADSYPLDINLKLLDTTNASLVNQERNTIQIEHWNELLGTYDVIANFPADQENFEKVLSFALEYKVNIENQAQLRQSSQVDQNVSLEKTYLFVPIEQKDEAKALGAKWDAELKSWYVPEGMDLTKFKAWEKPPIQNYVNPQQEFADFLNAMGANVNASDIQFDDKFHRIHITGDKTAKKNAVYAAFSNNGNPAGYFENFKTGEKANWTSSQTANFNTRTPAEIEQAKQLAAQKQQAIYDKTAYAAQQVYQVAPLAEQHAYLTKKGVASHGLRLVPDPSQIPTDINIKIGRTWQESKAMRDNFKQQGIDVTVLTKGDLMIPAFDKTGKLTTLQTISNNGFKSYVKDGQKSGSYLVLGEPKNSEPILIAEGYATAATLHEQLNQPVIVAFDSGNLKNVGSAIREKFPDSMIYFMADNDHQTQSERIAQGYTKNLNSGIEKAVEASLAINGYVVYPTFASNDKGSDFNDLYHSMGVDEMKNQIRHQVKAIKTQIHSELQQPMVKSIDTNHQNQEKNDGQQQPNERDFQSKHEQRTDKRIPTESERGEPVSQLNRSTTAQLPTPERPIFSQSEFLTLVNNHPSLKLEDKKIINDWVIKIVVDYKEYPDFVNTKIQALNEKISDIASGTLQLPSIQEYNCKIDIDR